MGTLGRRAWLAGAGTGLIAVVGGVAWRAEDQGLFTPESARAAFQPWRDVADGRYRGPMALAAAGVLAASPHNTQPWLFEVGPNAINVHAVPARHLGSFDPYRREMATSLGCAVENIVLAAPGQGLETTVTATPGEETRLAHIALRASRSPASPLAGEIPNRRTNRHAYDPSRPLSADVLRTLQGCAVDPVVRLALMIRGSQEAKLFGDATVAATEMIVSDGDMDEWSHRWTRSSRAEVDRERSGLTLACAGLDPVTETMGTLLPAIDAKTEGSYWLSLTRKIAIPTAGAFGILAVQDPYDRGQSLAAGRLWQRLHLQGTLLGLAMQPLNQVPEMIDRDRQLGRSSLIADRARPLLPEGWLPTFCFRFGHPTRAAAASPRRALRDGVQSLVERS